MSHFTLTLKLYHGPHDDLLLESVCYSYKHSINRESSLFLKFFLVMQKNPRTFENLISFNAIRFITLFNSVKFFG